MAVAFARMSLRNVLEALWFSLFWIFFRCSLYEEADGAASLTGQTEWSLMPARDNEESDIIIPAAGSDIGEDFRNSKTFEVSREAWSSPANASMSD